MKAFLINLPEAVERRDHAVAELEKAGLSYQIIEGIRGSDLEFPNEFYDETAYGLRQGRKRIPAEVGCYLSHLKAIKTFLQTGDSYGLILEDDVILSSNLKEIIQKSFQVAQFDLLRLSTVNSGRWTKTIPLLDPYHLGVALSREKGAGAYVVNRKAAEKIRNQFIPMKIPFDHRFDLEWFDGFRTLGVSPSPVRQGGFRSQIQINIRSYYRPAIIRYWTVFPFRTFWEISRFFFRLSSWGLLQIEKHLAKGNSLKTSRN